LELASIEGCKMVGERDPLTQEVIGAAIEVHREMGPGLLESVYQKCLERELLLRGMNFQAQARLPRSYKRWQLDDPFVIDFFSRISSSSKSRPCNNSCQFTTLNF
jgi:hypothetical protein